MAGIEMYFKSYFECYSSFSYRSDGLPSVPANSLRELETKQEEIIDILKSIAPAKLNSDSRDITDSLTNVRHQATPRIGKQQRPASSYYGDIIKLQSHHREYPFSNSNSQHHNTDSFSSPKSNSYQDLLDANKFIRGRHKTHQSLEGDDETSDGLDFLLGKGKSSSVLSTSPRKHGSTNHGEEAPYREAAGSKDDKLNPSQIKDLLALTRIAELTAMKKEGVSHPSTPNGKGKLRPLKAHTPTRSSKTKKKLRSQLQKILLKKPPQIKGLLNFLIHSKKSKDLLKFLRSSYDEAIGRTEDVSKRQELTDKYNKALHRLLKLWNKRLPADESSGGGEQEEEDLLKSRSAVKGSDDSEKNPLRVG